MDTAPRAGDVETLRTFVATMMALATAARAPACVPRGVPCGPLCVLGVACRVPAPLCAYFARAVAEPLTAWRAHGTPSDLVLTLHWAPPQPPARPRTESFVFRLAWDAAGAAAAAGAGQRAPQDELADMQDALRRAQMLGTDAAMPAVAAGRPSTVAVTARTAHAGTRHWRRAAAREWDADAGAHTRVVAIKTLTVGGVRVQVLGVVTGEEY